MKTARLFLLFATLLVTKLPAQRTPVLEPTKPDKPNILLIIVDDLGYADLGCLGSNDLRTPVLDALFASSLKLNRLYANCPVCSPTRASVISGCYPDRVGVPGVIRTNPENSWGNFSPANPTLPQQLKSLGYETGAIGKWHLGLEPKDHPMNHGFDTFHGFLGDMMDDYYHHLRQGNNYMRKNRDEINPEGHATDLFSRWAADFIGDRKSADENRNPWFLYLAYNAPHTPIQPPEDWLRKVKAREPGMTDARAKLAALIEHMDAGIGKVLQALQDSDQENTIVVFLSDNGGQLNVGANNGSLRDGKQSMYEGGLRIPGCLRVPGFPWSKGFPTSDSSTPDSSKPDSSKPGPNLVGASTDAICMTADLLPTLVELAGGRAIGNIDGRSLTGLLSNPDQTWSDRELYFVRREGGRRYSGLTIEALLQGNLKLVHNLPTQEFELFDLSVDPGETTDLSELRPKEVANLLRRLQFHLQRGGAVAWQ